MTDGWLVVASIFALTSMFVAFAGAVGCLGLGRPAAVPREVLQLRVARLAADLRARGEDEPARIAEHAVNHSNDAGLLAILREEGRG